MERIKKAPFFRSKTNTANIMADVLIALIPVIAAATWKFGIKSLIFVATGIISAVLFEFIVKKIKDEPSTINDLSACVTGTLLGLSFPVTAPIWLIVLGTFIAIVLVKQLPGGLGKNVFNPAVFARVIIKVTMTPIFANWVMPLPDGTSTATPLAFVGHGSNMIPEGAPSMEALFFGNIGGNIGEVVKWAILIGYIYLCIRRIIHPAVPFMTLVGLFFTMLLFGKSDYQFALYHVLSGTAMFASVFMVTDYTSGTLNPRGKIYYALLIGILTGILRQTFDLPGGIGVAILVMNIVAPVIDSFTTPKVFGHRSSSTILSRR